MKIFDDLENKYNLRFNLLIRMKRIREIELKIAKEYKDNRMRCPVHLSVGQEATSAAISLIIKKADYSVSTHRGHAHYLAKGGNLNAMIAELYGKSTGCSGGKGGSMHLIDTSVNFMGTSAIVGNSIPTGTGLGLAAKLRKEKQISLIHIGDGAIEEGSFYESINFACLKKLPTLYVCENNFYSVYSPLSVRQPEGRSITKLAKAIGAKAKHGDGNDALQTYRLIKKSVEICRSGKGPVFLELDTYRTLEHCGPNPDDDLNYRSEKEINTWRNKDPIKRLENMLSINEKKDYDIVSQLIDQEIEKAFEFAKRSEPPPSQSAYKKVYSEDY